MCRSIPAHGMVARQRLKIKQLRDFKILVNPVLNKWATGKLVTRVKMAAFAAAALFPGKTFNQQYLTAVKKAGACLF